MFANSRDHVICWPDALTRILSRSRSARRDRGKINTDGRSRAVGDRLENVDQFLILQIDLRLLKQLRSDGNRVRTLRDIPTDRPERLSILAAKADEFQRALGRPVRPEAQAVL